MNEARRRLTQGAILGFFIGSGAGFVMFWHIVMSSTNAGAMVDGQFHPYQGDPTSHIFLSGGLIMIGVASALLVVTWRNIRTAGS